MREHVLLFCLLGLVLTATIKLVIAPEAVTWALALIEWAAPSSLVVAFSAGGDRKSPAEAGLRIGSLIAEGATSATATIRAAGNGSGDEAPPSPWDLSSKPEGWVIAGFAGVFGGLP
jgi:hypothetical protein